jgi:hypothetical protein
MPCVTYRNVALNEEQMQGWGAEDVVDMTSLLRHVHRETNKAKKNVNQEGVNLSEAVAGNTETQSSISTTTQWYRALFVVQIRCKQEKPLLI